MPGSRQASSNASEGGNGGGGGYNRESSLDDSGVVDDHYDLDTTGADLLNTSNVEVSDSIAIAHYAGSLQSVPVRMIQMLGLRTVAGRRDAGDHCADAA